MSAALVATRCPICRTAGNEREVYAMNFRPEDLDAKVFSARRTPDRLHYRMVRCNACGLLRSDPILPLSELARLYRGSKVTYENEAVFTRATYAAQVARAVPADRRGSLMEIGCGDGFFLEAALELGFREVHGIEPGEEPVARAKSRVRPGIKVGLYDAHSFAPASFDVICAFQVFDHVPDPRGVLEAALTHLKPGGVALFINHDCGAPLARLLGDRNPIVDVEHTVLFDRATMRRIFEASGFAVREVFAVKNTYPIDYWARMTPLPKSLKSPALSVLRRTGLGRLPLTFAAGNLGLVAEKRS